jgi:arsenate reductase-like glutaredoxin family protein
LTKLIAAEPNLMRRPIVRFGKRVVIGFDKEALGALIEA